MKDQPLYRSVGHKDGLRKVGINSSLGLGRRLLASSMRLARKRASALRCSKTLQAFLSMRRMLYSATHVYSPHLFEQR